MKNHKVQERACFWKFTIYFGAQTNTTHGLPTNRKQIKTSFFSHWNYPPSFRPSPDARGLENCISPPTRGGSQKPPTSPNTVNNQRNQPKPKALLPKPCKLEKNKKNKACATMSPEACQYPPFCKNLSFWVFLGYLRGLGSSAFGLGWFLWLFTVFGEVGGFWEPPRVGGDAIF